MGDGELWREYRRDRAAKRESNRDEGARLVQEAGYDHDVKNNGAHIIIRHAGVVWDYWPGTGRWQERRSVWKGRGVRKLLDRISHLDTIP